MLLFVALEIKRFKVATFYVKLCTSFGMVFEYREELGFLLDLLNSSLVYHVAKELT